MLPFFQIAFDDLVQKAWSDKLRFDDKLFNLTKEHITKAFDKGFGEPHVNLNSKDYLRLSLNEANVARFAACKTVSQVLELNLLKNKSENYNEFKKAVAQTNITYNDTWLKAEYDTAFTTGQTSADYWRQMASKELFPYVRFETMGDSRVRDSHAALDGKVAEKGTKLHDFFNPPLGYNCRCRLRQLSADEVDKVSTLNEVKSVLKESKIGSAKNSALDIVQKYGFGINRAKTNEVFTDSQFFIKGFKESGLSYKDYSLQPFDKMRQGLHAFHGVGDPQFFEKWKGANNLSDENMVRLLDYRHRPVLLRKIDFNPDAILSALRDPSEVWLVRDKNLYSKVYLKFYHNKAVKVTVKMSNDFDEQVAKADFTTDPDKWRKGVKLDK